MRRPDQPAPQKRLVGAAAAREKAGPVRRVAAALAEPGYILLLLIAIGSLVLLFLPSMPGNPEMLLHIVWWPTAALVLLWRLAHFLFDNRHYINARLGLRPPKAPASYVRALFDDYADYYDNHLMVELAYAGPNLLRGAVDRRLDGRSPLVVDLGCGTGICGPLFRPLAETLIGVDLSPDMLARAEARGIYDRLVEADLVRYMAQAEDQVDLCLAADVFVYIGDLAPAFRAIAAALSEGGYFAFTTEAGAGRDWTLQRSGRYAHGRDYILSLARQCGLIVVSVEAATLRTQRGEPVTGDVWLLQRPTVPA